MYAYLVQDFKFLVKKCGFGIPYAYTILLLLLQKKKSSTAHNMI
jgi:hypothetical protein